MLSSSNNISVFFELLRAGLWERDVRFSVLDDTDFSEIYQIAEYQSVIGLVTAGFEHLMDVKVQQDVLFPFIGTALQLEQRNKAMNEFLSSLIERMRAFGIYAIVVKGQGIAQCYERPLWRTCGDVDLFLSDENYEKAKGFLLPLASMVEREEHYKKHLALTIEGWVVELHGNLYSSLSRKIEKGLDEIYRDTFYRGNVRSWQNGKTQIFQLTRENDVIYVFTHILQHYFHGGIGLRQICDWCRLLWYYKELMNCELLESKIREMGLLTEWKAFAYFAVNELEMPEIAMPFYEAAEKWTRKSQRIKEYVIMAGNFGHRDLSYVKESSYLNRKFQSLKATVTDLSQHFKTFPLDSIRFFFYYIIIRISALFRGE